MNVRSSHTDVAWFCRQVRARSREHREAMSVVNERGWSSIAVGILRQELDSLVRVIFLTSQSDRCLRARLLEQAVSGEAWTVPTSNGRSRKVRDREMVDRAQNIHGWAQRVYRFGCGFIHLSNLHDYLARDPFQSLPPDEREWIAQYLHQYHDGKVSLNSTFDDIKVYIPKVLEKIASNLEHYLNLLESGG